MAPVTTLDAAAQETSHRWPRFLPDGKRFLFMSRKPKPPGRLAVEAGSRRRRPADPSRRVQHRGRRRPRAALLRARDDAPRAGLRQPDARGLGRAGAGGRGRLAQPEHRRAHRLLGGGGRDAGLPPRRPGEEPADVARPPGAAARDGGTAGDPRGHGPLAGRSPRPGGHHGPRAGHLRALRAGHRDGDDDPRDARRGQPVRRPLLPRRAVDRLLVGRRRSVRPVPAGGRHGGRTLAARRERRLEVPGELVARRALPELHAERAREAAGHLDPAR